MAWQKARALTADVYRITRRSGFREDFGLKNQVQRAAVSVMSNIAEGFERYRRQDKQYLSVARGSAAEVRSQLYVALDLGYLEQLEFNELKDHCVEVRRLIAAMRATIRPRGTRRINLTPRTYVLPHSRTNVFPQKVAQ